MESVLFCRVMIVDDEYIIRQGIEYLLDWEKEGFKLVGDASNGEEALGKIEELQPDIILSDIVMPKVDGIDLTKKIQQKYPHIKVIILSSFSDFDYVKNTFQHGAVDYILKPTLSPESLLKVLKKVANEIPGKSIQNTQNLNIGRHLSRYLLGFDEILDTVQLKEVFPESNYFLFATNKKFYKRGNDIDDFFHKELYTEMEKMHPCTFQLQEGIILCILNTDEVESDAITKSLETILMGNEKIVEHAFFALSDAFSNITDIKKIYDDQIWSVLQTRFYYKDCKVFVHQQKVNHDTIKKFDNRSFNKYLDTMNLSEALQELWKYVMAAMETRVDESEIKSFVGNSLYNFISVLEDHDMNMDSVRHFKLNCINLLESAIYKEEFIFQLTHIYEDFKIIIEKYEVDSSRDSMQQILKYMNEHYDEPLSLNDLANQFGFSYHYLSSYFASQSDGTFTEHLNHVRIEKARSLLDDKQYSISEVGSLVGYSDHSYFCKVFKKLIGMTPSEYRKR